MNKKLIASYRTHFVLTVLLAGMVLYATIRVMPPRHIRIAAGPIGGTFYETALQYKRIVEAKGYRVDIIPFANTDEIGDKVADPEQHLDIGFVSEDLGNAPDASLMSLGDVQLQPLFIFETSAAAHARPIHSYADLRGMSIVLPPLRSLTSRTVLEILAQSGIDQHNTRMSFLPLDDGMRRLQRGEFDVGLFILGAESTVVADLAKNPRLVMAQPGEQEAIAKKLSFLRAVTLPTGVFDLANDIPDRDIRMLAATISVVARRDMPVATQYVLLEAMQQVHRPSSYVNRGGEFPRYAGNTGTVERTVEDFYRNGTPWVYSHLSPGLASVVDTYMAPLLALSFAFSAVGIFSEFEKLRLFILFALARAVVWRLRRLKADGRTPSSITVSIARQVEAGIAREADNAHRLAQNLHDVIH